MSERITHIAVCDDGLRLMLHMPEIHKAFKDSAKAYWEIAQIGADSRGNDSFTADLLGRIRTRWDSRRPEERLEPKLAYVLGARLHLASDRTMKPVFRDREGDDNLNPRTVSIYHDVTLFREVYRNGLEEPLSPALFSLKSKIEPQFKAFWQGVLLDQHEFVDMLVEPDRRWLVALERSRQEYYVDLARYAEAYEHPDPDLVRKYITEPKFYDAKDDLVRLARAIQRGESVAQNAVPEALESGKNGSQYAHALARGLRYLRAANNFFLGKMPVDQLRSAWDVDKEHWYTYDWRP